MSFEHEVQQFYTVARPIFEQIMGDQWHHGDPDAVAAGLPRRRACEMLEERIVGLTGLAAGGKALDFGSGIGGPTLHMAKVSKASFVGVCNNDVLTQAARKKATELGLSDRVEFKTLDDTQYKNLPYPDNTFDAATFFESPCHIPDKAALFRELARVIKPGGRLAGIDWLQRPFGEYQTEEQIMQFMGPLNEAGYFPWHGTLEGYVKMMKDAGLEVPVARDLFAGVKCWTSVQEQETPQWLSTTGPEAQRFADAERAMTAAREAGVFTVGMWVARKPA